MSSSWISFIFFGSCFLTSSYAFLDSYPMDGNCTEFACRSNNKCISQNKRCDGKNDCLDLSDEEDCDMHLCKAPHFFKCINGHCITAAFLCDGENDCRDWSDERTCDSFKLTAESTPCVHGEWMCTDKMCIPEEFVCNGQSDCLDGSDETVGCTQNLPCDTFKCKNHHCIPNEWVCDKRDDCGDNSDEIACETSPKDCKIEDRLFLCKNNRTCVNADQVCNNASNCPDGSDEGGFCSGPKDCKALQCSHDCINLPTGAKCFCPKGFKNLDSKTCVDVNECEVYGICDHICRNTQGSFECFCDYNYKLQDDKRTCKARGGEALMIFSSKTEIRGYYLSSKILFPIARNLKQVVGVGYDGEHVYWTDIFAENEAIMRSLEDGSQKELIVTAGLGAPEDLAVDWITKNVYFTDSEMKHIGVCTNDGIHCTVIVNEDVSKPRGIALHPKQGEMYWSDWGKKPLIGRSKMDGKDVLAFVDTNIHWPNGVAIDYPNNRLYWTDAKLMTMESINLDGTDRRIILENIVKHPYGIAVFENKLFWSDWATHSLQSCNKFTGKNHTTLFTERKEYIFGIHIYHSSIKQKLYNPCSTAFCSDICLLSGNSYSCACPVGKELASDNHVCKAVEKDQILIAGVGSALIRIEHKALGKHYMNALPSIAKEIGVMAYNDDNNTLYVYDSIANQIISTNIGTGESTTLHLTETLGSVSGMAYDYLGGNLYWCDATKTTVEALNIKTMSRKVILHDLDNHIPTGLTLVPEEGIMFVAFEKTLNMGMHIDRFHMDGSKRTHVIEEGLLGPISLTYDRDLHRVIWADAGTGNIESTSADGDDRHGFRSLQTTPLSITSLKDDIFWTNMHSKRIYWAKKYNSDAGSNKKITLDVPDSQKMYLVSVASIPKSPNKCRENNGNCSHLCLLSGKNTICDCPIGMHLKEDNKVCFKPKQCDSTQFHCVSTDTCVSRTLRCNGKKDCFSGEDEEGCENQTNFCGHGKFQCENGQCIKSSLVCDLHYDCKDKSDETNCDSHEKPSGCKQFLCKDGSCIFDRYVCDGIRDCFDGDDELACESATCSPEEFRCLSGGCLPKHFECDGEYDCFDLSDEHNGCEKRECLEDQYACDNEKCVDKKFVCNGVDDCGDLSDEFSCGKQENGCNLNEFQCTSNRSICLPLAAKCNGTSECPHHEDEKDCSSCHVDEFSCKNGMCIPTSWICDGSNDCMDNSDETAELCNHTAARTTEVDNVPCSHGFRCKTGHCIDMSLVCNNEENCYDGSDEHGACKTACLSKSNPCVQKCVKTPSGPMCDCFPGYRLLGDGLTCVDVEECKQEPPVCSQLCAESVGNFSCGCYDGFVIRPDRRSCKGIGTPMQLIYSVDNEIHQLSQKGNKLSVLYSDNIPPISGLDASAVSNYLYFSIKDAGILSKKHVVDDRHKFIEGLDKPSQIAVDWITNNVYYADGSAVHVCNFATEKCALISKAKESGKISALAVDAINKYIIYSVTNWWNYNTPNSAIYLCNLDGSKAKELTKEPKAHVTGIAFDVMKKKIYYADHQNANIYRMNYDGSDKVVLFALNHSRPNGLQLFEDHLYFLTVGGYMEKCNLFGKTLKCVNHRLSGYAAKYLTILHESRQPKQKNICAKHNCTHLCIPSDVGVRCLCESGKVVKENEKCDAKSTESAKPKITFNNGPKLVYRGKQKESSGSIAAGILIPMLCVVLAIAIYVYLRKRKSGQYYINFPIKFSNKTYSMNGEELTKKILEPEQHEYCNPMEFKEEQLKIVKTDNNSKLISFET